MSLPCFSRIKNEVLPGKVPDDVRFSASEVDSRFFSPAYTALI
jgi:hypothetical protein